MKKKRKNIYLMHERISSCIDESGMTCTEIAKHLNVNRKTIYAYRNGDRVPDVFVLWRLCELFNVSISWMIEGK